MITCACKQYRAEVQEINLDSFEADATLFFRQTEALELAAAQDVAFIAERISCNCPFDGTPLNGLLCG